MMNSSAQKALDYINRKHPFPTEGSRHAASHSAGCACANFKSSMSQTDAEEVFHLWSNGNSDPDHLEAFFDGFSKPSSNNNHNHFPRKSINANRQRQIRKQAKDLTINRLKGDLIDCKNKSAREQFEMQINAICGNDPNNHACIEVGHKSIKGLVRLTKKPSEWFELWDKFEDADYPLTKVFQRENNRLGEIDGKFDFYICTQPTTEHGRSANTKQQIKARDNCRSWQWLLIEDDTTDDIDTQKNNALQFAEKSGCVKYILFSGNKSIHMLLDVGEHQFKDIKDKPAKAKERELVWNTLAWQALECGIRVDQNTKNIDRMTRLAGAPRWIDNKSKEQSLLYMHKTSQNDTTQSIKSNPKPLPRKEICFRNEYRQRVTFDKGGHWFEQVAKIVKTENVWFSFGKSKEVVAIANHAPTPLTADQARADLTIFVEGGFDVPAGKDKDGNREFEFFECMCPRSAMQACLSSTPFKQSINQIKRIIRRPMPSIVKNKIFVPQQGYNAETQEYYAPALDACENIEIMSKAKAKAVIDDAIKNMLFDSELDRACYVATLFDPFFDSFVKTDQQVNVPMVMCVGNQSGIGKDATREIQHAVHGWEFESVKLRENDKDETDKVFGTRALEGQSSMHIDESGSGAKALQNTRALRSFISGKATTRMLGKSKSITTPRGFRFSMSCKNDIILDDDMLRRTFPFFLSLPTDAKDRKWDRDLQTFIAEKSWLIYCALHSMIVKFIEDGRLAPAMKHNQNEWDGQFLMWSRFVGALTEFAGFQSPFTKEPHKRMQTSVDTTNEDESMEDFCETIGSMTDKDGTPLIDRELSFKDLIDVVIQCGHPIEPTFEGKLAEHERKRLGRMFMKANGRVFGSYVFKITKAGRSAQRRKYAVVIETNSTPDPF